MTNYSTAVMVANEQIKAVNVIWEPEEYGRVPRIQMFKTLDHTIKVGDKVVVPCGSRFKQCICEVKEVDVEPDYTSDEKIDWIIDVVNNARHEIVLKKEKKMIEAMQAGEKLAKKKELHAKMKDLHGAGFNFDIEPITAIEHVPEEE